MAAGYTVTTPKARIGALSPRPNFSVVVAERETHPLVRKGGFRTLGPGDVGFGLAPNPSGRTWCVTVPSGLIVVRRHGKSMVCGNCAQMSGRDGGGGRIAILVGRDGYLKCARRDPDFIDVDSDVVYDTDDFLVTRHADGSRTVEHSYGNPAQRGEAHGAYAIVRRKGKPDRYFYAPLDQYAKRADKSAWGYRDAMAIKAAVSYILRITYGVNGPVPADEVGAGLNFGDATVSGGAVTEPEASPLPERIRGLFAEAHGLDPKSWRENEVRARIFGADGEVLIDSLRRVEHELVEWLEQNRPADAEVVDEPHEGTEPPSMPDETEREALNARYRAAGTEDAEEDEREWRGRVDDLLNERAEHEYLLQRAQQADEPDAILEHDARLDAIDGQLGELGIPPGWLPPSDGADDTLGE